MSCISITTSPNISELCSRVYADLCGGNFLVDVTPSTFLPGGTSTSGGVQGACVRITNPVGVIIKNYCTSGFDIEPPMTGVVKVGIPLIASNYAYGTYTIDVKLVDHDGNFWVVTKNVNICPPDPENKTRKTGCLGVSIQGNCSTGKVIIMLNQVPNYKGVGSTTQVNAIQVDFPAASTPFPTTFGSFSMVLYEGSWKVTGTVCATYPYGDNVYFKVKYTVKGEKDIKCTLDKCCVTAALDELRLKLKADCTSEEKTDTFVKISTANDLVNLAEWFAQCGKDPSDVINELEDLLGCQCTCQCNDGEPIINTSPVTDYSIEGCGVEMEQVGLTRVYTINNYSYKVISSDSSVTVGPPILNTDLCQYQQDISIPTIGYCKFLYRGILTQVGTASPTAVTSIHNLVTIAWTRSSLGAYIGTITGLTTPLTAANTFCIITSNPAGNSVIAAGYNSANTILVKTTADGVLNNSAFQLSYL